MVTEQRKFRADPLKLKRLRVAAGLTVKEFKELAVLDRTTSAKLLRGDPVLLKSIAKAGKNVFEIDNPMELLHPEELQAMGVQTEVPSPGQVLEWEIDEYVTGWEKTSNGLQFQRVKLAHRYLPNRFARGKCYELRHLTGSEQQRVEQYLLRHVEVCEQIGQSQYVAQNVTAAPIDGLWWVLDRWEEGETLEQRLTTGPLGDYSLQFIMRGILCGLRDLHSADIIRRELLPRSILLRQSDDRPVLTDMELAKLTGDGATVSPSEWPDDPYRALEVSGDAPIDERADLYSWGRIFVHAATGSLPERGAENIENVDLPDVVRDAVMGCVELTRSDRPASVDDLLDSLEGWQ